MFEVAVIVLPRTGYSKMVTARIDCKYVPPTIFITFRI